MNVLLLYCRPNKEKNLREMELKLLLYLSIGRKIVTVKSVRLTKFNYRAPFNRRESIEFDRPKGNLVSFRKLQKFNNNSDVFYRKDMKIKDILSICTGAKLMYDLTVGIFLYSCIAVFSCLGNHFTTVLSFYLKVYAMVYCMGN